MRAAICTACPDSTELRRLLDSDLAEPSQAKLVAHLDACESCAAALEAYASGGKRFAHVADHLRDTPAETSAFWPALRKLGHGVAVMESPDSTATRAHVALKSPADSGDGSLDFLDPAEKPNTLGKLGRFHVVGVIGRGGMGMVLSALDVCLQRQVALKVLDPQYAKNEIARSRFIREARAAAAITHENVVAVHHVERHREDLPYLVMRLVTGESLQDLLDESGSLTVPEILRIGKQVASGLAAAHEAGLIHRDIKPANILLEKETGRVLLTDFGLARAVEDTRLTQTGFVPGTPLYMSPEQARGETLDHRSDLFSLGSVLYAMATGNPPFQGSSPFVVLREVTETRHRPVQEANPKIPEDLAGVIDHLLEKEPRNRMQSAGELRDILETLYLKYPAEGPTPANPNRTTRRLPRYSRSWWGRHGAGIGLALLMLNVALLTSELAKITRWTVLGQRNAPVLSPRDLPVAVSTLPEDPWPAPRYILNGNAGTVWSVAIAPDSRTLAMALDDGSIKLWDPANGAILATIDKAHHGPIWCVRFNHDGSSFATASDDGYVRLWDTATHKQINEIQLPTAARAVAFSPDSKQLATGSRNGIVRIWDAQTGQSLAKTQGHAGVVMAVAFSADGKSVASASGDKTVKVWDAKSGDNRLTLHHPGSVYTVAFNRDSSILASAGWDGNIILWDTTTGDQIKTLRGHKEDVWSVAFTKDGTQLISGSEDRTVKVWDIASGKESFTYRGHTRTIYSVSVADDGKTIASGSRDGTVRVWDLEK